VKTPGAPQTPRFDEPIRDRWTDRGADGTTESAAGSLLRAAAVDEPVSDVRLATVRARLSERPRRVRRSLAWQLAFGLAVTLGGATLVVAATTVTRWIQTRVRAPQVAPAAPPAVRGPARHHRAPVAEPVPDPVAPAVPAGEPPPPPPPAPATKLALNDPHPARRAAAPAAPPAGEVAPRLPDPVAPSPSRLAPPPAETPPLPPPSTQLARESALLAKALRVLRQDGDAPAALQLFDEHAQLFPSGALALEERVGRAEALLQLGRRSEALALLDGMELPSKGRRRDMLVTRGELRAGANRCAEALIDFGLALTSESRDDTAAERALYGRASCRARLGDADGARADLRTYLERFPTGRFAGDARATLRQ
jgi:hypothetical protein